MAKKNNTIFTEYRDSFVELYPTEKNPYHAQGVPFMVHPDYAKHLVQKGMASTDPPVPEEEGGEKE